MSHRDRAVPAKVLPRDDALRQKWALWTAGASDITAVDIVRTALAQHRSRRVLRLWDLFEPQLQFCRLFHVVLTLAVDVTAAPPLRACCLEFLCLCLESIEVPFVRKEASRIVSVAIWSNLSPPSRIEFELSKSQLLGKLWRANTRKFDRASPEERAKMIFDHTWLSKMIQELHSTFPKARSDPQIGEFVKQLLRLLVLLECQLFSRRYVQALLRDHQVLRLFDEHKGAVRDTVEATEVQLNLIPISDAENSDGKPNSNIGDCYYWLDCLQVYYLFSIDEHTGSVLSKEQHDIVLEDQLLAFQSLVFKKYPEDLPAMSTANLSKLQNKEFLVSNFSDTNITVLQELCSVDLHLRTTNMDGTQMTHEQLVETLNFNFVHVESPISRITYLTLFPLPCSTSFVDKVLPPLSLQYLSTSDYLLRHCAVYRRECAHTILAYIDDCIARMRPNWDHEAGKVSFNGRCRMALPIVECSVKIVGSMAAFDTSPSRVEAEVRLNMIGNRFSVVGEWDKLSKDEVVFLVNIHVDKDDPTNIVIKHIRGATVEGVLNFSGTPVRGFQNKEEVKEVIAQDRESYGRRILRLLLDRHQFAEDRHLSRGTERTYGAMNIIVRRNRRENNSWWTIRAIMETFEKDYTLPHWLREAYLGYGDPMETHYSRLGKDSELYFHDTFISSSHLKSCFPHVNIEFSGDATDSIVLKFDGEKISAQKRVLANTDPFAPVFPNENKIPFTPTQVEAIRAGSSCGLSLIVGPPGTGKTDVTVQILSNLYHGRPTERVLLLTHGNQALNQLFEKLLMLNHIPEHHLLRLGHSEDEMTQYDQYGRVTHFMERRANLLYRIDVLAKSMGVAGDHAFTCETASSFFKVHVQPAWEKYWKAASASAKTLVLPFPFARFFEQMYPDRAVFPRPESALELHQSAAESAWRHLEALISDVRQSQAFEVFKRDQEKGNYLLAREARIVAMTTTYASIRRRDLIDLGFEFESLIMEEAGTVMEVETFVALSLSTKLKRLVLVGDQHQLPPVVQCPDLHAFVDSLFVRFLRLGAPQITLDKQGRTRESICRLYQHVYPGLTHLPQVAEMAHRSNAGLVYDYQFIDVHDYQGAGEVQPAPHHYQNLGEAEYVVAVYIYLRQLGYPLESIVVLTTYNGQKDLLKEVMNRRCAWNPTSFEPCHVTTVDKYQGQQCDYVLMSLVRTRQIGHFGDIRRLVVAMSRARLGLYIFGRFALYAACVDLAPTFQHLAARPGKLALVLGERYAETTRAVDEEAPTGSVRIVQGIEDMAAVLDQVSQVGAEAMDTR